LVIALPLIRTLRDVSRSPTLTSPDGDQWQVRRHWLDRPVPKIRRSLPDADGTTALEGGIEAFSSVGDSIPLAIGVAIVVALFILILLPLIGVAIEIALLIALLSSGIVGRVLLRRPWIIEAVNLAHPQQSGAFAVKGWRQSSRAITELATTIPVSGLPKQISVGTPIAK
jgi:hypothetical protein